jgi:hypothetical protein
MKGNIFWAAFWASLVGSISLASVGLIFKVPIDYYLAIIGTVVTSLAFGFGTYFVVIAIDAYSQLQVVRGSAESAEKLAGSLKLKEAQFSTIQSELVSLQKNVNGVGERLHHSAEKILQIVVDYALGVPTQSKKAEIARERFLKQAHCVRYRFIVQSQYASNEAKQMAVLSLLQYGDAESLPLIKELLSRSNNDELKNVCEVAIKGIENTQNPHS